LFVASLFCKKILKVRQFSTNLNHKTANLKIIMSRNFLNLLTVLAVLFIITACVCRSDRDAQTKIPAGSANSVSNTNNINKEFAENDESINKKKDEGDFIVEHLPVKNPRLSEIDRRIKEDKTLEKAADKLNRSLILPRDIILRTKECGEVNSFYDSSDYSVTICYELMEHYYKVFRTSSGGEQKAYDKMFDIVRFTFLHELAHALIDVYKLPVTGNEEDAADRCSTYINLTELGDDGVNAVLAAADAFSFESKLKLPSEKNMSDEHLLQEQRFYNSLCLTYGSNQQKYSYLVGENYLPIARAENCPAEYERTVSSWEQLLAPWRKN
jgi:Putative metallopeptidase